CKLSKPTRLGPRATTAAPTKPSAKSCASCSWIPMLLPPSWSKSCAKPTSPSACARCAASLPTTACKKKLYLLNPHRKDPPRLLSAQSTRQFQRQVRVDAQSLERDVRQLLADKVSGNLLGLWLLVPEHLRLGTWDLLRNWSAELDHNALAPRLALHLIHEAALCRPSLRYERSLRHKGFELA